MLRRILLVLGGLVGLVMLLVVGVVIFLNTRAGERWLTGFVTARIDETLPGQLEIDAIDLGVTTATVEGITLRTPEGEVVATVPRTTARWSLRSLLRGEIVLPLIRVTAPELHVVLDPDGPSNVERALVPPDPPEAESSEGLPLVIERLEVVDAALRVSSEGETLLEGRDADLIASYSNLDGVQRATLDPLTAEVTTPDLGLARLRTGFVWDTRGEVDEIVLDPLVAEIPGAIVRAEARIADPEAPGGTFEVEVGPVAPELIARFAPLAPDRPISFALEGVGREGRFAISGSGDLPRGALGVQGLLDVPASTLELVAEAGGVAPSAWTDQELPDVPPVDADLWLEADATRGVAVRVDVDSALATADARGFVTPEGELGGWAQAEIPSFAALEPLTGVEARGSSTVEVAVGGTTERPTVELTGQATAASVADLGLGWELGFEGSWTGDDGALRVSGQDERGRPIRLAAQGQVEPAPAATVSELRVPLLDTALVLEEPVTVRKQGSAVELSPLLARVAGGRVRASGTFDPQGRSQGRLTARSLDLGRLPFGVTGTLGAAARIDGTAADPGLALRLDLDEVAVRDLPGVSGELGAWTQERALHAEGTLTTAEGGRIALDALRFPVDVRLDGAPEPVAGGRLAGTVDVSAVPVALAEGVLGQELPEGEVSARLALGGTLADPAVSAAVSTTALAWGGEGGLRLALDATYDDPWLALEAQATDAAGTVAQGSLRAPIAVVTTPWPEPRPLWEEPVEGSVQAERIALSSLAPYAPPLAGLEGALALDGDLAGTLGSPDWLGSLRLRARDVAPVAIDLQTTYASGLAGLFARMQVADAPPAVLDARVQVPVGEALRAGDVPEIGGLRLAMDVPAIPLTELPSAWRSHRLTGGVLHGAARVVADGPTPTASAWFAVDDLAVVRTRGHDLRLVARYGEEGLAVELRETHHGELGARIVARVPVTLTLPIDGAEPAVALGDELDVVADVPGVDLSILNAAVGEQGEVVGTLRGEARVTGDPRAPVAEGWVRLDDGQIFVPGAGVYYDHLELASTFDREAVRLDRLQARTGLGQLVAEGAVALADPVELDLRGTFTDFRAQQGPEASAVVDGELAIRGTRSGDRISGVIELPRADVVLAPPPGTDGEEGTRWDPPNLAPLGFPEDVVVVTTPLGPVPYDRWLQGTPEVEEPADVPPISPVALDVRVVIPPGFTVRNAASSVTAELAGEMRIFAEAGGEVRYGGEILVAQGGTDLLATDLVVQRGRIAIDPSAPLDPELDLLLVGDTGRYGLVGVAIGGSLEQPAIDFVSTEGYAAADVATLLLVGAPLSAPDDNPARADAVLSCLEGVLVNAVEEAVEGQLDPTPPLAYDRASPVPTSTGALRVGGVESGSMELTLRTDLVGVASPPHDADRERIVAEWEPIAGLRARTTWGDRGGWSSGIGAELAPWGGVIRPAADVSLEDQPELLVGTRPERPASLAGTDPCLAIGLTGPRLDRSSRDATDRGEAER